MTDGRPARAEIWAQFYASAIALAETGDLLREAALVADAMLVEYEQRFPMYEVRLS